MNHLAEHALIQTAAQHIRDGGVVAYPTESCFGLGCDPSNEAAIKRILAIKRRSADLGFILVADDLDQLQPYIAWHTLNSKQQANIQANWPAPVSFIIPASKSCSPLLRGKHTGLAVRMPDFHALRELCLEAGCAIISTSANRSGQAALTTAKQVKAEFGNDPNYGLDYGLDYVLDLPILGQAAPSKIIDAISLEIIRP